MAARTRIMVQEFVSSIIQERAALARCDHNRQLDRRRRLRS